MEKDFIEPEELIRTKTIIVTGIFGIGSMIVFHKPFMIYNTYNDFVIDSKVKSKEHEQLELIRDHYNFVYDSVPEGIYSLQEFETLALENINEY